MGLACSQIRLLTLTSRKADCEYGISVNSIEKMALTREQSKLTQEYNSKLQQKHYSYYANGQYNKMSYSYLMGYGANWEPIMGGSQALKSEQSMILTDYKGQVVLSASYASAITSVLGSSVMDVNGRGGTFSTDKIPAILGKLIAGYSEEDFKTVMEGGKLQTSYEASTINTLTGKDTGKNTEKDNSAESTAIIQKIIDFYLPIFKSAAANGWTTEYNKDMKLNNNYISDALGSGTFQLAKVDDYGNYDPDKSISYFLVSGLIDARSDSSIREQITAWYNAEKAAISAKEDWLDIENQDLSTELEAINTEMQAVKSLIDDAIQVFDWGSG